MARGLLRFHQSGRREYSSTQVSVQRTDANLGHQASIAAYKQNVKSVYGIKSAPGPDEFLNAKDYWTVSPARYKSRLHVLAEVIERTIQNT